MAEEKKAVSKIPKPVNPTVVMVAGKKTPHHKEGDITKVAENLVDHFKAHGFTVQGEKKGKNDKADDSGTGEEFA